VTDDGLLRAAVFKGLRDDLERPRRAAAARLPRRSAPSLIPERVGSRGVHGVPRENILQLLPDAVAPSKEELSNYWQRVAKRALVHLGRRPLKLVRHTHGVTFYHKGKLPEVPESVHRLHMRKRAGGEGVRVWVDDLEGLLGLVAMGAVELHPWNATIDDIERADRIVIDLDPGDGVDWDFVVETALMMRALLRQEGLKPWPKLTGGKGLHLMAPLEESIAHDAARQYARKLAQRLVDKYPEQHVLSASPARRGDKIFLDYLRNGRGNTAIGTYSPRARPHLPIAAPVTWPEVEQGIRPDAFTMRSPFRRTKHAAD
jgi:bifunctional non-homologous end joining protein LigD